MSLGAILAAAANPSIAMAASSAGQGALNTLVNINQARINRQFQLDMSSTAYQRAMADMRAAGLNPMLAYQQGGASTAGGSTASSGIDIASGVASALRYKLEREEQDNRNKVADAQARKLTAEATKEETTVPAYEWGQKLLLKLRPYADQVVDLVEDTIKKGQRGELGADLARFAQEHNLGTAGLPDVLKSETWDRVGNAIATSVEGTVSRGVSSAKQALSRTFDNAKTALKNDYLFKRHDGTTAQQSTPRARDRYWDWSNDQREIAERNRR